MEISFRHGVLAERAPQCPRVSHDEDVVVLLWPNMVRGMSGYEQKFHFITEVPVELVL